MKTRIKLLILGFFICLGIVSGQSTIVEASTNLENTTRLISGNILSMNVTSDKVQLDLSKELFNSKTRLVVYKNNKYLFETYNGKHYYSSKKELDGGIQVINSNSVLYGDNISIYSCDGIPGQRTDKNRILLKSEIYRPDMNVSLYLDKYGFEVRLNKSDFESKQRIVYYVNKKYVGETYNGKHFYVDKTNVGDARVAIYKNMKLNFGDLVEAYVVTGEPGNTTKLIEENKLVSGQIF